MTLQEISERFHIQLEQLKFYEQNGLLQGEKKPDGLWDYREADVQKAMKFCVLLKSGMDLPTLKHWLELSKSGRQTMAEQIRLLRQCRYRLLEEIHAKQQILDQLDYFIYDLKKRSQNSCPQNNGMKG